VALKKLEGVESVRVSLNRGNATLELRPGNLVTLEQVRQHVKTHGFTPKDARVVVRGLLVRDGQALVLRVSGTEASFAVKPAATHPHVSGALEKLTGGTVLLEGTVPEPAKGASETLLAEAARPAEEKPVDKR
jgi:hypothetical protein